MNTKGYRLKCTVQAKNNSIWYILIFNSIPIWGKRTPNLCLFRRYLERCIYSEVPLEGSLDLPERPELPERPPKYQKDQRIIGGYFLY